MPGSSETTVLLERPVTIPEADSDTTTLVFAATGGHHVTESGELHVKGSGQSAGNIAVFARGTWVGAYSGAAHTKPRDRR